MCSYLVLNCNQRHHQGADMTFYGEQSEMQMTVKHSFELLYFCITLSHLGWACLLVVSIKKLYFWQM